MSSIIKCKNITYDYYITDEENNGYIKSRALDGVSFEIEEGSFVSIVGMNGSGKSTLARHLNGLLVPTEGDVIIDNMNTKDDEKIWDIRSTVGMVFQNPDNQIVSSVVEDDVAFGAENIGIAPDEIRKRVDQALKDVEMYDLRKKAPHMLSGGQKQRIAIAGVIAMRPRCIVFDEPTAMLDPKGRKQVVDVIKRLNKEGITTILITHFMSEAAVADRIIVMKDGKIKSDGTPSEIFSDVKLIEDSGLMLPHTVELCRKLRKRGIQIPKNILDKKGMVEYICQLKRKN